LGRSVLDLKMGYRGVKVYEGKFPNYEAFKRSHRSALPKEAWMLQVQPGEFAVRYKDSKTGSARNPAGEYVQDSEICRIFSSLEEARVNSKEVSQAHWTVGFII
jgi:hypothetical protein